MRVGSVPAPWLDAATFPNGLDAWGDPAEDHQRVAARRPGPRVAAQIREVMVDRKQMAEDVVHAFGRAFEARDIEAIMALLDESIIYQNVPVPEMVGHAAVRKFLLPNLTAATAIRWEFLATVADEAGRKVLTERIDSFVFDTGTVAIPLMGIFEIADGKVIQWRDYADINSFVVAMRAIGKMPGPGIV